MDFREFLIQSPEAIDAAFHQAQRAVNDSDLAEDIVLGAVARVLEKGSPEFEDSDSANGWLYRVIENDCAEALRQRGRERRMIVRRMIEETRRSAAGRRMGADGKKALPLRPDWASGEKEAIPGAGVARRAMRLVRNHPAIDSQSRRFGIPQSTAILAFARRLIGESVRPGARASGNPVSLATLVERTDPKDRWMVNVHLRKASAFVFLLPKEAFADQGGNGRRPFNDGRALRVVFDALRDLFGIAETDVSDGEIYRLMSRLLTDIAPMSADAIKKQVMRSRP